MKKKNRLLIIGASGHGRMVADTARRTDRWRHIAFLDDNSNIRLPSGIAVIGKTCDAAMYIDDYDIFVGIGGSETREIFQSQLVLSGASIPTIIHPGVMMGDGVQIGFGTIIMAGAIINCDSSIGNGCIINTGATIDHENIVEDYVHISPGVHLAGNVKIGKNTWLGIGSIVSNNINIRSGCIIGAGAVVIRDVTEVGTYVGVPAKRVNKQ